MNIKPILFSADMVRAILEGRKTQTRRVIKPQPDAHLDPDIVKAAWADGFIDVKCPYGKPGDLLYVRETWSQWPTVDSKNPDDWVIYRATDDNWENRMFDWIPSIYMPRKYSRITLSINNIRVERLRGITSNDAVSEGIKMSEEHGGQWENYPTGSSPDAWLEPVDSFRTLWDSINGKDPAKCWAANPWVWVIDFARHLMNVDDFTRAKEVEIDRTHPSMTDHPF